MLGEFFVYVSQCVDCVGRLWQFEFDISCPQTTLSIYGRLYQEQTMIFI